MLFSKQNDPFKPVKTICSIHYELTDETHCLSCEEFLLVNNGLYSCSSIWKFKQACIKFEALMQLHRLVCDASHALLFQMAAEWIASITILIWLYSVLFGCFPRGQRSAKLRENAFWYRIKRILVLTLSKQHLLPLKMRPPSSWHSMVLHPHQTQKDLFK